MASSPAGANPARLSSYRMIFYLSVRLSMRSTKASAAVTRLNARDTEYRYSMGITASGFFYLLRASAGSAPEKISSDLTQEEFIELVNRTGPQKKIRVSQLDAKFEEQLKRGK